MQYVLSYRNVDGIKILIAKLKESGYEIHTGLDDFNSLGNKIIGICVDLDEKEAYQLNVTCMACWCGGHRKPLCAEEIVENYDRLILGKDYKYYEKLVKEKSSERK